MTSKPVPAHSIRLDRAISVVRLHDGVELRTQHTSLRITAVTEAIVRIFVSPPGFSVIDESWAVLPEMRQHSVPVNHSSVIGDHAHFATSALEVRVNQDSLHLTISDRAGHVLLDDVPGRPIEFTGSSFRVWKKSPSEERYFGLGDKPGQLDRRGRSFRMWNTDDPLWGESSDLLYKTIPFVLGLRDGHAWGLMLDNTWRSIFDFEASTPDTLCFGAEGGAIDFYVLAGPEPKAVLGQLVALTGCMNLPPLWALGYQQSRYSYLSQGRVLEVAAEHRGRSIPVDALWLDIRYQDRNRPFTVDKSAFPDLAGMVRDLKSTGIRTIAITDLHIAYLPQGDYPPFATGAAGDHFLRQSDHSWFIGESWPGPAVFPEFGRADTRAWWGSLYRDFVLRDDIDGFWNDMNEPSVRDGPGKTMPLTVRHRIKDTDRVTRAAGHAEMHNVYGLQNTQATYDGLLALRPEQRPFVLTRASYTGGHRYAATWTGDNASTWQHLHLCVPQLLNLGLSGFALSGCDIGGFGGSPSADLLTRWIQLGAFMPLFRNHTETGTADQEVWVHGPEHEAIRRSAIEARYRLLPYLYTLAEEASRTGVPIMRPMFMEFPDAAADGEDTQFLLGSALLVTPWPNETVDDYTPVLPEAGGWFDYWTGERVDPSAGIRLRKQLNHLAVFARAGSIVPHQPLVQSTAHRPDGPLTLHVYPGPDCNGAIYLDDGVSFGYRRKEYVRQHFTCVGGRDCLRLRIGKPEGSWQPWWRTIEVVMHGMDRSPARVEQDGVSFSDVAVDGARGILRFRCTVLEQAELVVWTA